MLFNFWKFKIVYKTNRIIVDYIFYQRYQNNVCFMVKLFYSCHDKILSFDKPMKLIKYRFICVYVRVYTHTYTSANTLSLV